MWSSQSPAEVAASGAASASDAMMALPENVRPMGTSILSQPSPCSKGVRPTTKAAPQKLHMPLNLKAQAFKESGPVQRSVFALVDHSNPLSSPVASGLAHTTGTSTAGPGPWERRTRSADRVQVFDEFREDRSRSRGEDDTAMMDVPGDDQENTPPSAGSTAWLANPGFLASPSAVAGLGIMGAWERAALRDLVLEVPREYQDDLYDDIDSSDGEEDMVTDNLAYALEERILKNEGDLYDFEIYCDP